MENELRVFENSEFGSVRTIVQNGDVWFVGKDVASILGYTNTSKALTDHVDSEDKGITKCYTLGGEQTVVIINESGLYSLVLSSKMPSAKQFKRWVTSEVLPSIRKNGGYISNQANMTPEQLISKALIVANRIVESQKRQLEEQKPLVEFAVAVTDSADCIDIGETAKVLNCGIGRNRLFDLLRNKGVLRQNNQPYQKFIDCGYFRVIEQKYEQFGTTKINIKTIVYQKGVDFIRKLVNANMDNINKE